MGVLDFPRYLKGEMVADDASLMEWRLWRRTLRSRGSASFPLPLSGRAMCMVRSSCLGLSVGASLSKRKEDICFELDGSRLSSSSLENSRNSLSNRTSGDSMEAVQEGSSEA